MIQNCFRENIRFLWVLIQIQKKRVGSYKLKANQYVTLKISYSSTNKIRVGIVSKSRKYVALKILNQMIYRE